MTGDAGDEAYNENPAPSRDASYPIHLHNSICQDTSPARCHTANEIKASIALLEIKSGIPCAEKINTSRIESSLEHTQNDAKSRHDLPVRYKTKSL
jgi:hypothetical protein